jgi:transposase
MRRVIGIDIHRTFGEMVIWENGELRHAGRVDMTRSALEGLGNRLAATDEVVIEATGNSMAVSRVLSQFVARVIIANPLQVRAIAHAHVKADKVDAGRWRACGPRGIYPRSGRRTLPPNASVGWWPGATRSCVIAHDSRTRSMRSCTRT